MMTMPRMNLISRGECSSLLNTLRELLKTISTSTTISWDRRRCNLVRLDIKTANSLRNTSERFINCLIIELVRKPMLRPRPLTLSNLYMVASSTLCLAITSTKASRATKSLLNTSELYLIGRSTRRMGSRNSASRTAETSTTLNLQWQELSTQATLFRTYPKTSRQASTVYASSTSS